MHNLDVTARLLLEGMFPTAERTLDSARMFEESLTPRPELENSQDPCRTSADNVQASYSPARAVLCPELGTGTASALCNEAQAPTPEMAVTPPSIRKSAPTTYAESSDAR